MADTVKTKENVLEIARLLEDHKGQDTIALYIGKQSSFTDYFIITTVNSEAHLKGLNRELMNYLSSKSIKPFHRTKGISEENWLLIDCGDFVIHLMNSEMRKFYELERLWYMGNTVFHSSKSS